MTQTAFANDRLATRQKTSLRPEPRLCVVAASHAAQQQPHGPNESQDRYVQRIVFKSRGRILFIPVAEIRWIAAEENYVRLCTEKETHLLRETMTRMEQKLDPRMFLRVHRSAIVNLQFVKEVRTEVQGDFVVHLVSGQKVAMSRTYRSRLIQLLSRDAGRVA